MCGFFVGWGCGRGVELNSYRVNGLGSSVRAGMNELLNLKLFVFEEGKEDQEFAARRGLKSGWFVWKEIVE